MFSYYKNKSFPRQVNTYYLPTCNIDKAQRFYLTFNKFIRRARDCKTCKPAIGSMIENRFARRAGLTSTCIPTAYVPT